LVEILLQAVGLVGLGLGGLLIALALAHGVELAAIYAMIFGVIGVAGGVILAPLGFLLTRKRYGGYRCSSCGHRGEKAPLVRRRSALERRRWASRR
jgi:threonine/homoserine/homoserine lactone efflux protein